MRNANKKVLSGWTELFCCRSCQMAASFSTALEETRTSQCSSRNASVAPLAFSSVPYSVSILQIPTDQGFDKYFGIPYSNDMYIGPSQKFASNAVFREGYTLSEAKAYVPVKKIRSPGCALALETGVHTLYSPCAPSLPVFTNPVLVRT